jgi:hypothetical protein
MLGGGRGDEKSAYSLVDLYNGTPRKEAPDPRLMFEEDDDKDKGALTMQALTMATPDRKTRSRTKIRINPVQTDAPQHLVGNGLDGPEVASDGMQALDNCRVSPATALSGSLTTMHLE